MRQGGLLLFFLILSTGSVLAQVEPRLKGIWQQLEGPSPGVQLDLSSSGSYSMKGGSSTESGRITVLDGKWTRTPASGASESGTFTVLGGELVLRGGSRGTTRWKRISSSSTASTPSPSSSKLYTGSTSKPHPLALSNFGSSSGSTSTSTSTSASASASTSTGSGTGSSESKPHPLAFSNFNSSSSSSTPASANNGASSQPHPMAFSNFNTNPGVPPMTIGGFRARDLPVTSSASSAPASSPADYTGLSGSLTKTEMVPPSSTSQTSASAPQASSTGRPGLDANTARQMVGNASSIANVARGFRNGVGAGLSGLLGVARQIGEGAISGTSPSSGGGSSGLTSLVPGAASIPGVSMGAGSGHGTYREMRNQFEADQLRSLPPNKPVSINPQGDETGIYGPSVLEQKSRGPAVPRRLPVM